MKKRTLLTLPGLLVLTLLFAACASTGGSAAAGADKSGAGGNPAQAQAQAQASAPASAGVPAGIPLPGAADKAQPAGNACNLKVLDWAGFTGAASYSYDDGQPSQIAHWKDIKALGVPMTFYLVGNSAKAGKSTWKDALASGMELGNHTNTHKQSSEYDDDDIMAKDVEKCAEVLAGLGVTEPVSFAYPFGDLSWKGNLGDKFLLARSVYSGFIYPLDSTDPLQLPIYPVKGTESAEDLKAVLDQTRDDQAWVIFMFHSLLPGDNWYAGVPMAHVTSIVNYAKAEGKLWQDTVENIGVYWLAQKLLTDAQPAGDDSAKSWTWTLPKYYPTGKILRVTVDGGTLSQGGKDLVWNAHGFYEVSLDAGRLDWRK